MDEFDVCIEKMKASGWRLTHGEAGYPDGTVVHESGLIVDRAPSGDTRETWVKAVCACIEVASEV